MNEFETKIFYVTKENYENTLARVFSDVYPGPNKRPEIYKKIFQVSTIGNISCHGFKRQYGTLISCLLKYRYCDNINSDTIRVSILKNLNSNFITFEIQNCLKNEIPGHKIIYLVSNEHHTASSSGINDTDPNPMLGFGTGGTGHSTNHRIWILKSDEEIKISSFRESFRGGANSENDYNISEEGLYLKKGYSSVIEKI